MRNRKLLTKTIIIGTLLSTSIGTLTYSNSTVNAKVLPVATTKDYNKLQKLANKSGIHYVKTRKWYASFIPGNNVEAIYTFGSYKLTGTRTDPGKDDWNTYIGAGTFAGNSYFIANQKEKDGKHKYLVPAAYCQVPYAYKLKPGHKTVYDYDGSLANAWNGYNPYRNSYGETLTKENIIYSSHKDSAKEVTLNRVGQNTGKNQGFWIGKTPITFRVDGTNTYEDYYPLYNYDPSGELVVSYIKTEDLDQFEPATVTYNWLGTITKNHKFKPEDKKLDL